MLKVACSGPGVSRTRNLLVTSPILYQLDHCTRAWMGCYVLRGIKSHDFRPKSRFVSEAIREMVIVTKQLALICHSFGQLGFYEKRISKKLSSH